MRKKVLVVVLLFIAAIAIGGYFALPPLATNIIREKILENPANSVGEINFSWSGPQYIKNLHYQDGANSADVHVTLDGTLLSLLFSATYHVEVVGDIAIDVTGDSEKKTEDSPPSSNESVAFALPGIKLSATFNTITFVREETQNFSDVHCTLKIEPGRIFHVEAEGKTDSGGFFVFDGHAPNLLTEDGLLNLNARGNFDFKISDTTIPLNVDALDWSILSLSGSVSTSKLSEAVNLNVVGELAEGNEPMRKFSTRGIVTLSGINITNVELTTNLFERLVPKITTDYLKGKVKFETKLIESVSIPIHKPKKLLGQKWKTTITINPEYLPSDLLGTTTTATIQLVEGDGENVIHATDGRSFILDNKVEITRIDKLVASLKFSDDEISTHGDSVASCLIHASGSLPKSLLKDLGPVLSDIASVNSPVILELSELKIDRGEDSISSLCANLILTIGDVKLDRESHTLPFLNLELFGSKNLVPAKFDPIKIKFEDGVATYEEFRLIVHDKYSISYSGTVNYNTRELNLKYIIPPALSGVPFDVVATITGTIDNPILNLPASVMDTLERLSKNINPIVGQIERFFKGNNPLDNIEDFLDLK